MVAVNSPSRKILNLIHFGDVFRSYGMGSEVPFIDLSLQDDIFRSVLTVLGTLLKKLSLITSKSNKKVFITENQ